MTNIEALLQDKKIDIEAFVTKYQNLSKEEQGNVMKELDNSIAHLNSGYDELLSSVEEVKSFMAIQEKMKEALSPQNHDSSKRVVNVSFTRTKKEEIQGFDEEEEDELPIEKRGRGRTPLIHELIRNFNLQDKAQTLQEEVQRINTMKHYNSWVNIATERVPHEIIMNSSYLASIQMLEANSKNANYSVLTRVMLNPSGAFFQGESVIIRNRYLETLEEASEYMERQMKKLEKQFFYEKSPIIIKNHGNRSSYYGFHLSKENRKNYQEALQLSK